MKGFIRFLVLCAVGVFHFSAVQAVEKKPFYSLYQTPNVDDGYCIKYLFVDFKEKKAFLTATQHYDEYYGNDFQVPNNDAGVLPIDWNGAGRFGCFQSDQYEWIDMPRKANVPGLYRYNIRNFSQEITAINGVPVAGCVLQHASITRPGANDTFVFTRIDDQHYTCEVNQSQ